MNNICMNMGYENFVKRAFSIEKDHLIGRGGDPAQLAEAGIFSSFCIEYVKAGVAYSMLVYKSYLGNYGEGLHDGDNDEMEQLLKDVINAKTKDEIHESISSYNSLLKKYDDLLL